MWSYTKFHLIPDFYPSQKECSFETGIVILNSLINLRISQNFKDHPITKVSNFRQFVVVPYICTDGCCVGTDKKLHWGQNS